MCSRSKLAVAVNALCNQSCKPRTLAVGVLTAVTVLGAAQAQELEEITVTGSRLRRDGMSTPTPLTAVDRGELRAMAPTLLMDALNQLPQFRDNDQSQTGSIFSTGGSNSVNLRGVGSNRTLTLLNGRRMVSGQQTGTVDIAMIPTTLIDRVEVVTGGASAAYGSDAISGVTNFILNTDFEGFSGNVQAGQTSRTDHESFQVEVAGGSDIGEHGHLVVSADYFKTDGVYGVRNRAWGQNQWALVTDSSTTVPRRFYSPNVNSRVINANGVIGSGPLAGTTFLNGEPVQLPQGEPHGSVQIGGGTRDLNLDWQSLTPDDRRSSLFAYYTHELDDGKEFFVQALRGQHAVTSTPAPTGFAPFWNTTIFRDNPYLPAALAQQMDDAGVTSFDYRRVFEQFAATRYVEDNTTSLTFGFDGDVGNDLYLSAYYQYGENIEYADYNHNYQLPRTDRFYRALDSAIDPATGRITCRANIPAFGGLTPDQEAQVSKFNAQAGRLVFADPLNNSLCVPFDPFAAELPQDAVDYIAGSGNYHHQRIKENILDVTLQTTLGENRGAGPISLGGGFSYRDESFYQFAYGTSRDPRDLPGFGVFSSFVDPADQIPIRGMPTTVRDRAIFFTGNPNTRGPLFGDFDVWEVYAESILPILGTEGGDHVDLHLAARYADYSGSGGVWAWKTGLDWQATDTFRLRATVSRDTRAGTLSERFDVQTGGTPINNGTNTDFLYPDVEQYVAESTVGGNPNVNPELADTLTLGFVYQPNWANNLSMSFDLYDITINDAIDQLGTQEILQRCEAGAMDICALITRVDADPALIRNIFDIYVNVSEAITRGADIEVSYARPITIIGGQDESIGFRLFANYLDEVSFQFAGAPTLNLAGELDYPEWLLTAMFNYNRGPFSMSWQTRWRDSTIRDVDWVEGIDIADNSVGGRAYTNLNLSYDFQWGRNDARAYVYVGNLFDKDPPLVAGGVGGTSGQSLYTDNGIFDVLGRTFTVGIQVGL
jgi:iron complex outermembrane recepter protein